MPLAVQSAPGELVGPPETAGAGAKVEAETASEGVDSERASEAETALMLLLDPDLDPNLPVLLEVLVLGLERHFF